MRYAGSEGRCFSMKSISEIAELTGISQRTLRYYDEIGLLTPTATTGAGYRLYDREALERLQLILLFRELGFPLQDIRRLLDSPDLDRNRAMEQQIELLTLKKQHLENLIDLARGVLNTGIRHLNLKGFNAGQIDEYTARARALYDKTETYQEYHQRFLALNQAERDQVDRDMEALLASFGAHLGESPESPGVQALVERLQAFLSEHFYECTPAILRSLANMCDGGGSVTENLDALGGPGTALLIAGALRCHAAD